MRLRKDYRGLILRALLGQMFKYFCIITTILIITNGIIARITGSEWILYAQDLHRFLLVALFAVLPILIYAFFESDGIILRIIHIGLTIVFALVPLLFMNDTGRATLITFLFIFVAIYGYGYYTEKRAAIEINKKLAELHLEEDATHIDKNET
ncbi:MAG: hypothetical protein FWD82_07290 [Defluviitaleaceae bacterium]|nr:hypothetical protein [Defluviitaleaceae bacterium]